MPTRAVSSAIVSGFGWAMRREIAARRSENSAATTSSNTSTSAISKKRQQRLKEFQPVGFGLQLDQAQATQIVPEEQLELGLEHDGEQHPHQQGEGKVARSYPDRHAAGDDQWRPGPGGGRRTVGHRSPRSGLTQVVRSLRGRSRAVGKATTAVAVLINQNAIGYQIIQNSERSMFASNRRSSR